MAMSKCGHCGSNRFEIKEVVPHGSSFKLYFVQCASCGVSVNTIEYMNISDMLVRQNAAIKEIADTVGADVNL